MRAFSPNPFFSSPQATETPIRREGGSAAAPSTSDVVVASTIGNCNIRSAPAGSVVGKAKKPIPVTGEAYNAEHDGATYTWRQTADGRGWTAHVCYGGSLDPQAPMWQSQPAAQAAAPAALPAQPATQAAAPAAPPAQPDAPEPTAPPAEPQDNLQLADQGDCERVPDGTFGIGATIVGYRIFQDGVETPTCDGGGCFLPSAPYSGRVEGGVVCPWSTELP